ncbi:radical SAM protein [Bradyrhizobium sp. UFLA05-153]
MRVGDLNTDCARFLLEHVPRLERDWDAASPLHIGQALFSALAFGSSPRPPQWNDAISACEAVWSVHFPALRAELDCFLERWLDGLNLGEADFIGMSLLNHQLLPTLALIPRIRARAPDARIVLGGFYVTPATGHMLVANLPIDAAVVGEGEVTVAALLDSLKTPHAWVGLPGVIAKDAQGRIVTGPPRLQMDSAALDALPDPDFSWLTPENRARFDVSVPVISIRGCFWGKCVFCSDFRFHAHSTARSVETIVGEIARQQARLGTRRFYFTDLASNDSIARMRALSAALIARGLEINFGMLFVPEPIDLETLQALRTAGCGFIQYGIESLSDDLLRRMAKQPRRLENLRCIKLTELAGISAISNLIKFHPGETPRHVIETIDMLKRFPELLNGNVFSGPVEFRARDGARIQRFLERSNWRAVDRAISTHFWPEGQADRFPDIEWIPQVESPNIALHMALWKEVEALLAENRSRPGHWQDDGTTLVLSKYDYRENGYLNYKLEGLARRVYLALEDRVPDVALPERTALPARAVAPCLDWLEEALLIFRQDGQSIATLHAAMAPGERPPVKRTVEGREERLCANGL